MYSYINNIAITLCSNIDTFQRYCRVDIRLTPYANMRKPLYATYILALIYTEALSVRH